MFLCIRFWRNFLLKTMDSNLTRGHQNAEGRNFIGKVFIGNGNTFIQFPMTVFERRKKRAHP